jgi:ATP synthase protein I
VRNQRGLQGAKRLFFVQISLVIMLSSLVWMMLSARAAWSIGLGGVVWVIPQICFACMLFADQRARFSSAIVKQAYRGEALKLFLSAILFAGAFRFGHVMPGLFFTGYMLVQGVSWFAPLFFRSTQVKASMSVV